jgi:anti-sigma factor RsiW
LQSSHLTDVETSDQHTVKPWFNGKLALSPPVVDLMAQGFTLIGGRLDYVDGEAMAAIVYKRRKHLINLFVGPRLGGAPRGAKTAMVQGFNVYHWAQDGLGFWAVSDINADELAEFGRHMPTRYGPAPPARDWPQAALAARNRQDSRLPLAARSRAGGNSFCAPDV